MDLPYSGLLYTRAGKPFRRTFNHVSRHFRRTALMALGLMATGHILHAQGTWVPAGLQDHSVSPIVVNAHGDILAASNTGLYRSTDNGTTWTETVVNGNVRALAANQNGLVLAAFFDVTVFSDVSARSTDWGATWTMTSTPGYVKGLEMDRNGVPIIIENDNVVKSTDNGVTWTTLSKEGFSDEFFDFRYLAIGPDNELIVGNGGITGGLIFRSADGGTTWKQLYNAFGDMVLMKSAPNGSLFISYPGSFLHSDVAGQEWGNIKGISGLVTSMMFHENAMYAVVANTNIYRSLDNGVTWSLVVRPPIPTNAAITSLTADRNGDLLAATSTGLYRFNATSSVDNDAAATARLAIHPQPVQGQAMLQLASPVRSTLRIDALDLLGRSMKLMVDGAAPGTRSVMLNTEGLAAGTYLVRVEQDGVVQTQRMVVAR